MAVLEVVVKDDLADEVAFVQRPEGTVSATQDSYGRAVWAVGKASVNILRQERPIGKSGQSRILRAKAGD